MASTSGDHPVSPPRRGQWPLFCKEPGGRSSGYAGHSATPTQRHQRAGGTHTTHKTLLKQQRPHSAPGPVCQLPPSPTFYHHRRFRLSLSSHGGTMSPTQQRS